MTRFENNMTFKEGGNDSSEEGMSGGNLSGSGRMKNIDLQQDGGSGSTVKKVSKKDKFKNFFKKHK